MGDSAGYDIGDGNFNTMLGQAAGWATEHADYNTMVGWSAGGDNNRTNSTTDANRNTYLGARAGYLNRIGEDNVGVGAFADFDPEGSSTSSKALDQTMFVGAESRVRESFQTVMGYSALADGQYTTLIGWNGDARATRSTGLGASVAIGAGADDAVAIGSGASVAASNEAYVGNAATTSIGGIVNWTATSDARLKTDVTSDVPGLDFVRRLNPVRYRFDLDGLRSITDQPELADALAAKAADWQTGFLAQEVADAADATGFAFSGVVRPVAGRAHYGLRYAEFVVPLTQAVQELDSRDQNLEARVAALEAQVTAQDRRIAEQRAQIGAQEAALARYEALVAQIAAEQEPSSVQAVAARD